MNFTMPGLGPERVSGDFARICSRNPESATGVALQGGSLSCEIGQGTAF